MKKNQKESLKNSSQNTNTKIPNDLRYDYDWDAWLNGGKEIYDYLRANRKGRI
jgi:hypothetical protein